MAIKTDLDKRTIQELADLYKAKRLNLEPAFQRWSVWTESDRRLLVNSIFDKIPLPSLYLYKRTGKNGVPTYDVVDGKQRIETILAFMRTGPVHDRDNPLYVKRAFTDDEDADWWEWRDLNRDEKAQFLDTKISTIEVDGELSEIIELFVRINATGKKLTAQEKRNARFYSSPVLEVAQRTADQLAPELRRHGVLSRSQIQRMKHIELITELLLAFDEGMPLNKKSKIDQVIKGDGIPKSAANEAATAVKYSINLVLKILPDLKATRFHRLADFYTLTLLLHRYKQEGLAVSGNHTTSLHLAGQLLREFGASVDTVNNDLAQGRSIKGTAPLARNYLMTVKEGTDSKLQRDRREKALRSVLDGVFDGLDPNRTFNTTQRRILWQSSQGKECRECGSKIARWEDVAVDHIHPHIKGGRTKLSNAALCHKSCNARKGAK